MPKRELQVQEKGRPHPRRAASQEALKQMHLILDDEAETLEIPDDDEDVVAVDFPSPTPPPQKKYKISHRKSSDGDREVLVLKTVTNNNVSLDLECWPDELSEEQVAKRKKIIAENEELQKQLDHLVNNVKAEVVFKGEYGSIYEVSENIQNILQPSQVAQPQNVLVNNGPGKGIQVMVDPRLGYFIPAAPSSASPPMLPPPPPLVKTTPKPKLQVARNLHATTVSTPTVTVTTPSRGRGRGRKFVSPMIRSVTGSVSSPRTAQAKQIEQRCEVVGCTKPQPPFHSFPIDEKQRQKWIEACGQPSMVGKPFAFFDFKKICHKHFDVSFDRMTTKIVPNVDVHTKPRNEPPPLRMVTRREPSDKSVIQVKSPATLKGAASKTVDQTVVDLTQDNRIVPDSREISFNKLQGKTYPSLVVVARPHLRAADPNTDRNKLDAKVKLVLMNSPSKFTEWLIQQGLVKAEQKCSCQSGTPLKLGMYSDITKFPHSGGYVWISECCPDKFVSVFNGSIFEGCPHPPPTVILKLLYHWACQTNIHNVVQWVKVDNLFVKNIYTHLRSVCTVGLHTHIQKLGGPGVKVEVGVISLGTTSQDGAQRQVKVEVLGILETKSKLLRLRAVDPLQEASLPMGNRNYRKRFSKILEPILEWINPSSTIVTDLTVDRTTLTSMGYHHVVQSTNTANGLNNNTIMEYLRKIVPRMFQNTLSLLSRQIIQQFLDELVWREWYGTNPNLAFDNLILHLSEQTRFDANEGLLQRLNRVTTQPFQNWSLNRKPPVNNQIQVERKLVKPKKQETPKPVNINADLVRPQKAMSPDIPEQMVPLENYYYGTINNYSNANNKINLNITCQFCKTSFDNNLKLMNHLFRHAHNASMDAQLCRYCLASVPTSQDMVQHLASAHPSETKFDNGFSCLICESQYMNLFVLGKHMSQTHCPSELPYQCGTCSFRCSNHKQIIDHFYKTHDNASTIQCPFCLKSTTVYSSSRNIVQNLNFFIQHLQKHQKKAFAKKCGKCNLWFITKEEMKQHQLKMHISQRGKSGLVPWTVRNSAMAPKSRMDINPGDANVINFTTLFFNVKKNAVCKECDKPLNSPKHFPSFESCQNNNCQYSTCCTNAMEEHKTKCSKQTEVTAAPAPLEAEMFCACGFKSSDGNILAKHLAICEKKSAYPSLEDAKKACVTHSMLDVLGLVRKPEEVVTETKSTEVEKEEITVLITDDDDETIEEMGKKSEEKKDT